MLFSNIRVVILLDRLVTFCINLADRGNTPKHIGTAHRVVATTHPKANMNWPIKTLLVSLSVVFGITTGWSQSVTVTAPTFTMDTSDGSIVDQPVTTTFIDASRNYIGFEADMVFDSAVAMPSPGLDPVVAAGLTASGWNVTGNVLNTGPGTLKTLRVSAYVKDANTPLSGSGTLYLIHWQRVSIYPEDVTPLTWSPFPNDFQFIDTDLNSFSPVQSNGLITITGPPVLRVKAPTFSMDTSVPIDTVVNQTVNTSTITPSVDKNGNCTDNSTCLIGFQADLVFDSAIAAPSPSVDSITPAGLTATGWTIGSNVLNTGPGTLKTLRVSAFVDNGITPLSGAGPLYNIRWVRVATSGGLSTALTWRAGSDGFFLIDYDLNSVFPAQTNGLITITGPTATPGPTANPSATATPSPTPAATASPSRTPDSCSDPSAHCDSNTRFDTGTNTDA